jgi:hypothetical protein
MHDVSNYHSSFLIVLVIIRTHQNNRLISHQIKRKNTDLAAVVELHGGAIVVKVDGDGLVNRLVARVVLAGPRT